MPSQRVNSVATDYSVPATGASVLRSGLRIPASESRLARESVSVPVHAPVYAIDPLRDRRWETFIEEHPRASVFHTMPWLNALQRTYGYEPVAYTTSPPGASLQNGLVFCRVESWVTGRRLVALPFSDHCESLVDSAEDMESILSHLEAQRRSGDWKYIEMRPLNNSLCRGSAQEGLHPSKLYHYHTVDLRPDEDELLRRFHASSIQRRIRRGERAGLVYEKGRSSELLGKFYQLMLLTRMRHHIPPQPEKWFRNVMDCMGDALTVWVVSRESVPVASMITLRFKNVVSYKYGCSNSAYRHLGSTPSLLWRVMREAKSEGAEVFDLGRSDYHNRGIITFKDRWASTRSSLTYWRLGVPAPAENLLLEESRELKLAKHFFGLLPKSAQKLAGRILYRHIG